MARKNFIRLDKVNDDAYVEPVVHPTEELINGMFVNLGTTLNTSEGEAVSMTFAEEGKAFDAFLAPVYIDKGYPGWDITLESVKPGKPARAIHVEKGMIISINEELVAGVKGDNLAVAADGIGLRTAVEGDVAVATLIDINYYPYVGDVAVIRFK